MITVGSLCSGYGGLDLGLELGLGQPVRHAWHVEYDQHPSAILAARYPGVPNYGDVKTTSWVEVEPVDWLTAGYPCQPFSLAGLRKGADDPRHLWPGVAHAIGVLRPRGVLLENVAAHLRDGFDVVLGDLASLGYDARWGVVRAADAGAPHGRARLFIVATHADRERAGWNSRAVPAAMAEVGRTHLDLPGAGASGPVAAADTYGAGLEGREPAGRLVLSARGAAADSDGDGRGGLPQLDAPAPTGLDSEHRGHTDGRSDGPDWGAYTGAVRRWEAILGRPAPRPTQPAARGTGERLSPAFVEWMMGLPAGWVTDVPGLPRNAQLKALGNGVVPQQAALAVRLLVPATQERAEVA